MALELILDATHLPKSVERAELHKLLASEFGFSVIEVDELLDQGPLTVATDLTADTADQLRRRLESLGGRAMIVRSRRPHESSSPSLNLNVTAGKARETFGAYLGRLRESLATINPEEVSRLGNACLEARAGGHQILIMGNGGSAATASHMANDFLKHGHNDPRYSFRVLSLTDNTSWLTAIGNDFGYAQLFVQQLRNLLRPEDLVIAISSSGNSPNILEGVKYAKAHHAKTFGIVGFGGGELCKLAQDTVYIPSAKGDYGVMEDCSLVLGHVLSEFFGRCDSAQIGGR